MVVTLNPRQERARRSIIPTLQEKGVAKREELKPSVPTKSSALCRRRGRSTVLSRVTDRGCVRRGSDLDVRDLAEGQLAWDRGVTTCLSIVAFVDGREDRQLDRLPSNL